MIIKNDINDIKEYLTDASCFEGYCDNLYIPNTLMQLQRIVTEANASKTPLTIAAAGTGLTGSRVPLGGDLVSMENFNSIFEFSQENRTIMVQPFVRLSEIDECLAGTGLFYPPNPTEKLATIGGNIGNNASGSRTYKYGATRNYVNKIGLILPNGDTLHLCRGDVVADNLHFTFKSNEGNSFSFDLPSIDMPMVKHAAAYYVKPNMDLIDLFIGAEGTLGIVTSIELRLLPTPETILGAIVFFDKHNAMYEFLDAIKKAENKPRLIEFFDNNSLDFLRTKISQIPEKAYYAIWLEFETNSTDLDNDTVALYEIASKHSNLADDTWIASNDSEHRRLAEFRHSLPLAVYEKIQEFKQQKLGTDSAVPDEFIQEYHEFIINLFDRERLEYVIWGHIGNSHLHANIITKTDEEFLRARQIFEQILKRAVELGGTISAEHGIGKIKKIYLPLLFDEETINGFRIIKKAMDPNLILNIGNIFDV